MKSKVLFLTSLLALASVFTACRESNKEGKQPAVSIISEGLRFCESTYPYKGGLLIANFGTEELNPLNTEGKGYVSYYKEGKNEMLIPSDGNLSAPKGMFVRDGRLFICDVNKIVVYNLNALEDTPHTIRFPEDDLFINDLAAEGNNLYASVTNSGRIYRIDLSNPATIDTATPVKWADIPGPNGLAIANGTMYVASYPADGQTTDDHVIYQITDLQNPVPQKLITLAGQYDGITLSADKKTMYITNWSPAGVSTIDMESKQVTPLLIDQHLTGPADITLTDSVLYIPDLPNSRVIAFPL